MLSETFRGRDLPRALAQVRAALGEDAVLLRTRTVRADGASHVEVVATTEAALDAFRARLERVPLRLLSGGDGRRRARVIALVGPTGAGKTTTLAKLALRPEACGGERVGVITLDTFRVGALEQLSTYTEILGLPLEVVYTEAEVAPALERLRACDVILVDTPGRSPKLSDEGREWRTLLQRIGPDEVHLVLPAGSRTDVALATRDAYVACGTTHLLLTKLDEVPGEDGVAELADALNLPARWVATGQDVAADLEPAAERLIASLCGGAALDRAVG